MARLVCLNRRFLAQQEAKLINAVQQTMLGEGVNREAHGLPAGQRKRLSFEVNRDPRFRLLFAQADKLLVCLLIDHDRQEAVFERVV